MEPQTAQTLTNQTTDAPGESTAGGSAPGGPEAEAEEGRGLSLTEALATLEERTAEASSLRAAIDQRDAEMEGLRRQLAASTVKYRETLLASHPDVPPELLAGATPEELDASLAQARSLVERIRSEAPVPDTAVAYRVPAGAPVRRAPDLSGLSPQEKIAHALGQGR